MPDPLVPVKHGHVPDLEAGPSALIASPFVLVPCSTANCALVDLRLCLKHHVTVSDEVAYVFEFQTARVLNALHETIIVSKTDFTLSPALGMDLFLLEVDRWQGFS